MLVHPLACTDITFPRMSQDPRDLMPTLSLQPYNHPCYPFGSTFTDRWQEVIRRSLHWHPVSSARQTLNLSPFSSTIFVANFPTNSCWFIIPFRYIPLTLMKPFHPTPFPNVLATCPISLTKFSKQLLILQVHSLQTISGMPKSKLCKYMLLCLLIKYWNKVFSWVVANAFWFIQNKHHNLHLNFVFCLWHQF